MSPPNGCNFFSCQVRYCAAGEAACWRSCTVTGLSEELAGRVELAEAIVFCWLASLVQVPLFVAAGAAISRSAFGRRAARRRSLLSDQKPFEVLSRAVLRVKLEGGGGD